MLERACFFIRGEKIEKVRNRLHLLSNRTLFIMLDNLMNPLVFGIPDRVCFGDGAEPWNGSVSLKTYMIYNKNGHIFWYNNLHNILSYIQGGITYVPIPILSHYEKL